MHASHTISKAAASCAAQKAPRPQCVYKSRPCEPLDAVKLVQKKGVSIISPRLTLDIRYHLPLEAPESIKELALRPRISELIRRRPLPDFFPLSSLLRCITGVSATGKATLVGSGDLNPFVSAIFDLAGRPGFLFFCSGCERVACS